MVLESRSRGSDHHRKFQILIAVIFLSCAVIVGLWMLFGPHDDAPVRYGVQLFLIEMPLFIILALIGMNALVRLGMGPKMRH